jgi:hypothetical protein
MPNFPESDFLLALHRAQFCQESGPIPGEPASGKGPTHVVRNRRASGQLRKVKVPLTISLAIAAKARRSDSWCPSAEGRLAE